MIQPGGREGTGRGIGSVKTGALVESIVRLPVTTEHSALAMSPPTVKVAQLLLRISQQYPVAIAGSQLSLRL